MKFNGHGIRMRLRQSEGFLNSVLELMALDLAVPDHTTLSRRARTWKPSSKSNDRQSVADGPIHVLIDSTGLKIYGAGQWLEEKHGAKSRRGWRKLHLAVDADGGEIMPHSLTNQGTGDVSQLEPLLDQIDEEICQFTADGAYDGTPTYHAVLRHSSGARVVIPPRSNAVERPNVQACCQRDGHIASMQIDGRLKWQTSTGYGKRALVETAMGRYEGIIGPRLRALSCLAQQTEAAIGVTILNRMLACGRPKSVRFQASAGAIK
ncbi:IS5 family transposase [Rhizobium ruizarguesonis]|uniref:IS5 family transposase n=2 Tax=Rhizobium ruizarguesonis TaxID=2081791 RepID=UPI0037C7B29B